MEIMISTSDRMRLSVFTGFLIFSVMGCSGEILRPSDEPGWVQRGRGAFLDKNQKSFYGVGVIFEEEATILGRANADQRARAVISEMFESYVISLVQDYAASTLTLGAKSVRDTQAFEGLTRAFLAESGSAVAIIDHWFDPQGKVYYSLARLNLRYFQSQIEKTNKFNASVRRFVDNNAHKVFDQLDSEEFRGRQALRVH